MATTIYALCDPDLQIPVIRYIGKTKNLVRRASAHRRASIKERTHLGCWLKSLKARGEEPSLLTLTEVPDEIGSAAEILYIRLAREGGMDLVNSTDGGEGGSLNPSPETREKMRNRLLGKRLPPRSPSHCAALSASLSSKETREKKSRSMQGKKKSGATSKYLGVYWRSQIMKWQATINVLQKSIYLGSFESEIDAAKSYDVAALLYYGPDAKLNFPVTRCGTRVQ